MILGVLVIWLVTGAMCYPPLPYYHVSHNLHSPAILNPRPNTNDKHKRPVSSTNWNFDIDLPLNSQFTSILPRFADSSSHSTPFTPALLQASNDRVRSQHVGNSCRHPTRRGSEQCGPYQDYRDWMEPGRRYVVSRIHRVDAGEWQDTGSDRLGACQ